MALLKLVTDSGAVTVSASAAPGFTVTSDAGEGIPPAIALTESRSISGNIVLSVDKNAYTVKPSEAVNLSIDDTGLADAAVLRFTLLLDFMDGAQSVTFPDNFKWNGDVPALSSKGVHSIDVIRVATSNNIGYVANYTGKVAKTFGKNEYLWVYDNGVLREDLLGLEYIATVQLSEEGWGEDANHTVIAGTGVTVGALTLYGSSSVLDFTCIGANIGTLNIGAYGAIKLVVRDGYIERISGSTDNAFHDFIDQEMTITGGTIGVVDIFDMTIHTFVVDGGRVGAFSGDSGPAVDIRSGYVGYLWLGETDPMHFTMSGGTIGELELSNGTWDRCSVTGGTINLITSSLFAYDVNLPLSNCVVGEYRPNPTGWVECSQKIQIIQNVTINNFNIDAAAGDLLSSAITISVGPNCVVKLSKSTQSLVASGKLVFNADATAQIINL
jgi:hypothetical protein